MTCKWLISNNHSEYVSPLGLVVPPSINGCKTGGGDPITASPAVSANKNPRCHPAKSGVVGVTHFDDIGCYKWVLNQK